VPQAEQAEMKKLAAELMSSAITLSVPLKVDVKTGPNWGEME
jgi:DNA polymerase-1